MGNYMNMEIRDVETAELYMNNAFHTDGELVIFCAEWENKDCAIRVTYRCDDFTHEWNNKYRRNALGFMSEDMLYGHYTQVKASISSHTIDLFFQQEFENFFNDCLRKHIDVACSSRLEVPTISEYKAGEILYANYYRINVPAFNPVLNFLSEYTELCKKHNMSLSHQDGEGAFIIESYKDYNIDWVADAEVHLEEEE